MLQKFQPFLKIIVLVTVIVFTVSSCEKDIIDKQVEQKMTSFKVNTIKMTDIPNVTNHINRNLQRHINSRTSNTNAAIFDVDNVMEVIDSLQNTNYSIGFTFPETPTGTFYNLVVGKDTLDVLSTPFVLRYVSHADTYDAFVDSGYDMDYFNGTIHLHKYTDFFALGAFNRTDTYCPPEYDENGDPISCEDTSFDGGDTGAGSSGTDYGDGDSGDSGSGSGSGTGGSNLSITYEDCRCHNTHATGGCAHPIIVINIDRGGQQRTASNTEDCPDCDVNTNGGVGVNVPRMVSLLITQLGITDQNIIDWMEDPSNFDEIVQLNNYLVENNDSTDAINYTISIIDYLMNNPEDTFDDVIWDEAILYVEDGPGDEITDIENYLSCFDLSQPAKITLYIDQPKPNSADPYRITYNPFDMLDVGHTFIAIQQNEITKVLGYYPIPDTINPSDNLDENVISCNSLLREDTNHDFDVSITINNVSSTILNNIYNTILGSNPTYNLNDYNCTDFGIQVFNETGVGVSDTNGIWPRGGNGSNPGNLGQDVRSMVLPSGVTRNTTGGTSPSNSGTCD